MYAREDELRAMLRRAQLISLDDSGSQQLLDLSGLKSDRPRKVPRVTDFGFGSSPPAGADFILLSLGGAASRAVAIGGEHRDYRQANLPAGTSVLYDSSGNIVFCRSADGILIRTKAGRISVSPADGENLYLGGDGNDGSYSPVRTVDGPAVNVFAKFGGL